MMGSMLRRGAITTGCAATSAPPVPEDLELAVPGVILPTSADMTWSSGTGPGDPATSYVLEASDDSFSTVAVSVTTNNTFATLTGLTENVDYDFRVKAVNCFGDSAYHDALSGETTPLKTPTGPGSAAGLGATVSGTTITLDWDDESSAETGYQIERSTDGVSYSLIHTTAAGVETYADTGLAAGTYYYRVRAYDSVSTNSSAWLVQTGSSTVASSTYNVEYLVVAGGGGGGGSAAGNGAASGGGAGGYRTASGFTLTPGTSYTITVGAGGAGGAAGANSGSVGNNSVFSTITSDGGGNGRNGRGSGQSGLAGGSGGSGGGGAYGDTAGGAAGLGTSGQGNNGAAGWSGAPYHAAGGGGAGGAAVTLTNTQPGNGGAASASSISGSSLNYAGGGGGGGAASVAAGTAGSQGGNGGGSNAAGSDANANRGGGGGGAGDCTGTTAVGGAGGSGVVILRMATANYSGTTTGSPTVTTSGSDTILTYNASGTYTA